jgi:hypothetical protein
MKPVPASHLRIARPSHDLRASERFWFGGLGLEVMFQADDSAESGHALLMAGWPGAAWHLEFVGEHAERDGRAQHCFALALDDAGVPGDPQLRRTLTDWLAWMTAAMAPTSIPGRHSRCSPLLAWSWTGRLTLPERGRETRIAERSACTPSNEG